MRYKHIKAHKNLYRKSALHQKQLKFGSLNFYQMAATSL